MLKLKRMKCYEFRENDPTLQAVAKHLDECGWGAFEQSDQPQYTMAYESDHGREIYGAAALF
ncbi:MAG TPA: hypothetical protein DDW50_03695 [Firmicutes bacterium]|jgi:hypothetical protein|nr:hypothetical protein [Bacillota bacterium]